MSWYCDAAPGHPWHGPYHDREYGFPTDDETVLFERLSLEIFQAGLSWLIVLKKRAALRTAFAGFVPGVVAAFDDSDRARLVEDAGIIRNRRKIDAVIENARRLEVLSLDFGGLAPWLAHHHPLTHDQWLSLFRRTFVFMGREVVGEFLMSIGYLPGAHRGDCPVAGAIARHRPPWMEAGVAFYQSPAPAGKQAK